MMLTILCILSIFITYYLLLNGKNKKKECLLLSLMLFGQLILLLGIIFQNNIMIEISHILFHLTILLGMVVFIQSKNLWLIFISYCITFITRIYYHECLFLKENKNTQLINLPINYDYILIVSLFIIFYRIVTL